MLRNKINKTERIISTIYNSYKFKHMLFPFKVVKLICAKIIIKYNQLLIFNINI